jgi:putative phosphoesterase
MKNEAPLKARSQGRSAHVRHSVPLRDATLRIAVVADTHSRPHERSATHIAAQQPDLVLHAGDIGDLHVLDELATIAPVLAVRGNIDAPVPHVPDTMTLQLLDGDRPRLQLLVLHIAVAGPKLRPNAARLARSEGAGLVICGHSHVPFIGRDAGLVIFNPGSIGPRRFGLPIVFGLMEIDRQRVAMRHIDCETGLPWQP